MQVARADPAPRHRVARTRSKDIVAQMGVDPDRLHIVPVGVDQEQLPPAAAHRARAGPAMTTASADVPLKGLVPLLEALAKVRTERDDVAPRRHRQAQGTRARSPRSIERLGLQRRGASSCRGVTDERIVELYAEAEVAVVPSLYEGFSLPGDRGDGVRRAARRHHRRRAARGRRHRRRERRCSCRPATPTRSPHADRRGARRPRAAGPHRRRPAGAACSTGSPGARPPRARSSTTTASSTRTRSGAATPGRAECSPSTSTGSACGRGDRLLDLGCGGGRHAFEAMRRGATVVALDYSAAELKDVARRRRARCSRPARSPATQWAGVVNGDALRLPFPDDIVRPHHRAPRCSSTSGTTSARSPSSSACCARAAASRSPCPTRWPERVCWALNDDYHDTPGGHVRIYRQHELEPKLERAGLCAARLAPRARAALAVLVAEVRVRARQHRRRRRCAATTTSSCGRSSDNPRWVAARRPRAQPGARQEPRRLHARRSRRRWRWEAQPADATSRRRRHRGRARARPSTRSRRSSCPTATSRGSRAATPTRGTSSRRRWRSTSAAATPRPSARTTGCARMQHADGVVARVLPRRRRRRTRRSTPTSPATSPPACGTTTSATGDTAFLERALAVVERAIDFALDYQTETGEIAWRRRRPPTTARCSPARRASTISLRCAIAIAERLGHERPDWELSLGALAIAIAHRPERFLDKDRWAMDWYYPILGGVLRGHAARRAHRGAAGTRSSSTGRGVRCVSDQPWVTAAETCELVMALDAIGETRARARAVRAGCSSSATTTARYWTGMNFDGDALRRDGELLHRRAARRGTRAAVVLAANALGGDGPDRGPVPRRGPPRRASPPRSCSQPASRSSTTATAADTSRTSARIAPHGVRSACRFARDGRRGDLVPQRRRVRSEPVVAMGEKPSVGPVGTVAGEVHGRGGSCGLLPVHAWNLVHHHQPDLERSEVGWDRELKAVLS